MCYTAQNTFKCFKRSKVNKKGISNIELHFSVYKNWTEFETCFCFMKSLWELATIWLGLVVVSREKVNDKKFKFERAMGGVGFGRSLFKIDLRAPPHPGLESHFGMTRTRNKRCCGGASEFQTPPLFENHKRTYNPKIEPWHLACSYTLVSGIFNHWIHIT